MTLISGMTQAGLELLAKSQTGKKIYFTRMKIGNGIIDNETNYAELTDLINVLDAINIQASEVIKQEDDTVALKVSSVAIQKDDDYYFREIGLFAIDPDTEDEILYAYINKGEEATYIPRSSSEIAIQELATMVVAIGNENNIIVNCDAELKVIEQIEGNGGYSLFDTVIKDHLLSYEELEGFALQGTFVYKNGIAGERWGYPDFIAQCIKEKQEAQTQRMTLGNSTIMSYVHANGHIYYDISDKEVVDTFFNTMGAAWFYGLDEENERVFLPRNIYFFKSAESNPGQYNAPQLPSLAHSHILTLSSGGSHNHSVTIGYGGSHTHTRGTMNITGTGILSSTRLTNLVSKGTINTSGKYYNNFYSGAFYMSNTSQSFPDVGDSYQGNNGGLVSFDASRSWTGSTSSSGNHNHSASVSSNGLHTHESTLSSTDAAGSYSGNTVQPPSVNGLLYIVVGNVRQKSAVVINAELQNAIATIQTRQTLAQAYINESKNDAIDGINLAKNNAIDDIESAGNEQIALINSDLNTANNYAIEAQKQAEIAERFANLAVAGQMQADFKQEDKNAVDYIKNKPDCDWENITYKENVQTLKNKTINAEDNIINNLTLSNISSEAVLTEINKNNISNDTLATSAAIYDVINNLPFSNKTYTTNISNVENVSDDSIPTSLAVYNAIYSSSNTGGINIVADEGLNIDTELYTNVSVVSSNPNLSVISTFEGTKNSVGTLTYNFIFGEYNENEEILYGWLDENGNKINISDYDITISGEAETDDVITLKYTTTSTTTLSADVETIANAVEYNKLPDNPNFEFNNGLTKTLGYQTTTSIKVTNPDLSVEYSNTINKNEIGIEINNFTYIEYEDEGVITSEWYNDDGDIVNLADYGIILTGTPESDDVITLTHTTKYKTTISTNFDGNYDSLTNTPTQLSEFTDNLGTNPVHTHSQYLTQHQDISGKEDVAKEINILATSGTITLSDNSINKISPTGAVVFTLPVISNNNVFHQILVQISYSSEISIDVGTTYFFNETAPEISETGKTYNLIYEYDSHLGHWCCGSTKKGAAA